MSLESGKGGSLDLFRSAQEETMNAAWYTFPSRNEETWVGLLNRKLQTLFGLESNLFHFMKGEEMSSILFNFIRDDHRTRCLDTGEKPWQ